jgi:DNA adenine methylase
MLIRYPGSKDKHIKFLDAHLRADSSGSLVEPFAGTASVTFHMLKNRLIDSYSINDSDPAIAALWKTIKNSPEKLVKSIQKYIPKVEDFYNFKLNPGSTEFELALRKIILHQISYSGLGPMAGGPLGGREQKGEYKIDARWRPIKLEKLIGETSSLLNSVEGEITNTDWKDSILDGISNNKFIYLDPPYFVQGPALYVEGTIDHIDLANTLRAHPEASWVMSYDDTPEIRELYNFAEVERLDVTSHLHHKTVGDVVIKPRRTS